MAMSVGSSVGTELNVLRRSSCLNIVDSTPFSSRKYSTMMGEQIPIGLGVLQWSSSQLETWILRIVIEEVLGYHTVFSASLPGSADAFYAIAGCQDPSSNSDKQCHHTGRVRTHLYTGIWDLYIVEAQQYIRQQYSNSEPLDLGTIGYNGEESDYVPKAVMDEALAQDYLPLEFYRSYSHPAVDPSVFFYSKWMGITGLRPCNDTDMYTSEVAERYVFYTGDTGGVENVTSGGGNATSSLVFKCSFRHWWLSPSCRANASHCIPWITVGGKGWFIEAMMQRAAIWKMPLALAVANSFTVYKSIPETYSTLFYGWWPDTTHLTIDPHAIRFPSFNELEWRRKLKRTNSKDSRVATWAHFDLGNRLNDGFARPREVAGKMRLTSEDIKFLMAMHVERNLTESAAEDLACQWLNNNTQRWAEEWIPSEGTCEEGQGIVDQDGNYLENRIGAKSCQWCDPGYMSTPFSEDGKGKTFICQKCLKGQMQGGKGEAFCVDCPIGEAASEMGLSACVRCETGRFADVKGLTQCTSCGAGFVTKYPGATGRMECVCPSGRYWDPEAQECAPCKAGMVCNVGSDARGFQPELAAQFPTVPMLTPSHWASAEDPLNVFRCENQLRCPGGRRPGDACAPGLRRQGCALCKDGYHWDGESCTRCGSEELSVLTFPVLPIFGLPVVILVMYGMFKDTYDKWGSWQNGVAAALFVVLNHYQVVGVQRDADIGAPSSLRSIFNAASITMDFTHVLRPECAGFAGFGTALAIRALAPVFLFLGYVLTFGSAWLISQTCHAPAYMMDKSRTLNGFFALIFTFYTGIASLSFTIFKCGMNPNGKYSLMVDRSITCYEGEWMGFLAIGVLSVLFWCMGFGLIFMWRIYTIGDCFHDENVQMRWKFLFIRYRADVHWWALIVVGKGISLNLGFIFIASIVGQIFWVCITLSVYILLVFLFRPMRHQVLNGLDLWAHMALILSSSSLYWFAGDSTEDSADSAMDDEIMARIITCAVLSIIPISVPCVAWIAWRRSSDKQLEQRAALGVEIQESFADLAARGGPSFFKTLSEWDFWVLSSAHSVIEMELNQRRSRRGYSSQKLEEIRRQNSTFFRGFSRLSGLSASTSRSSTDSMSRTRNDGSTRTAASRGMNSEGPERTSRQTLRALQSGSLVMTREV